MLTVTKTEEQFRKSIYSIQNNPQHKTFFLDKIGQKVGRQNIAYILMSFSSAVYPLGFIYTNDNNFTVCQNFLVRSIAVLVMNVIIARIYHIDIEFRDPHNFKILFIRNGCVTIQGIIYTLANFYLPQPVFQTINSTGLIFVFIIDYLINRTTITRNQFYGVMFGIGGVLLTVNGQLIMHALNSDYQTKSDFKHYMTDDPKVKLLIGILFAGGNAVWAYAQVITKQLNGVNAIQINIHQGIYMLIFSAILYPIQVRQPVPVQIFVKAIFYGGSIMSLGSLTFIGAAIMTKKTGVITMFMLSCVIQGYLVSIFRYNQSINIICTIGAILIVVGLAKIVLTGKNDKIQAISEEQSHKI